eukprot:301096_1
MPVTNTHHHCSYCTYGQGHRSTEPQVIPNGHKPPIHAAMTASAASAIHVKPQAIALKEDIVTKTDTKKSEDEPKSKRKEDCLRCAYQPQPIYYSQDPNSIHGHQGYQEDKYDETFDEMLRTAGNYREFIDIQRQNGSFPKTTRHVQKQHHITHYITVLE